MVGDIAWWELLRITPNGSRLLLLVRSICCEALLNTPEVWCIDYYLLNILPYSFHVHELKYSQYQYCAY